MKQVGCAGLEDSSTSPLRDSLPKALTVGWRGTFSPVSYLIRLAWQAAGTERLEAAKGINIVYGAAPTVRWWTSQFATNFFGWGTSGEAHAAPINDR